MEGNLYILENGRQPQYDINILKLVAKLKFLVGKDGLASPACPELGTAQPQLVLSFILQ